MSKFISENQYVDSSVKRRPLGPIQAKVDRAVQRYIADAGKDSEYSALDVAKATKQKRVRVLKALRRLDDLGAVKRVGLTKTSEGRGRKSVMFASA